jgi:hypothetical protein
MDKMDKIEIDLRFGDEGYGITEFSQSVDLDDGKQLEFVLKNLGEDETERANAIAARGWAWVCGHLDEIKDYLSAGLAKEFEDMRRKKERNVPADDAAMIREQLRGLNPARIAFYPEQELFDISFMGIFNSHAYPIYVTVNDDFTFKNADILTGGGLKPSPADRKPNLKKAAALHAYHLDYGNTKAGLRGLYKHYAALPAREIEAYVDLLIAGGASETDADADERKDCLLYLALFAGACGRCLPDRLYRYLIDNEVFYYGEIYLRAHEKFAEELIAALDSADGTEDCLVAVNHVLCALAMMPCKRTNDFFLESSRAPLPLWAGKLHILPKGYAYVGGWEASADGPRKLYSEEVKAFTRCKKSRASSLVPIKPLAEVCRFCGQPLILVIDGERKLATCLHCACYQTIFVKTGAAGVLWHEANAPGAFFRENPEYMACDEEISARFEYGLRPSTEKRTAIWAANYCAELLSYTQIGGLPTAINDINYPQCPDCGRTMRFAAQLGMGDIEEYGEGLYYFFACEDCGVAAANYDQT